MGDRIQDIPGNEANIRRLIEQLRTTLQVIPFVGAGVSVPYGFQGWSSFLLDQARLAGTQEDVALDLKDGRFEEAAEKLLTALKTRAFEDAIEDAFGDHRLTRPSELNIASLLPSLTDGPVITTNFDHVLETAFTETGNEFGSVVYGVKIDPIRRAIHEGRHYLVKIHGDVYDRTDRVLTSSDYDQKYVTGLEFREFGPVTLSGLLEHVFSSRSMLFIGARLEGDRVVESLKKAAEKPNSPAHYAIAQAPSDESEHRIRAMFFSERNVRPIWYPEERHHLVPPFLQELIETLAEQDQEAARLNEVASESLASPPAGPNAPKWWSVPYPRDPNFVDREDVLRQLEQDFSLSDGQAVSQAVHGLAGVGKTHIAVEYAYRNAEAYDLIWWVRSRDETSLSVDLAGLGRALQLPGVETAELSDLLSAVSMCLGQVERWLLVFDGIESANEVRRFLPSTPNGDVLITSQNRHWTGLASSIALVPMAESDAAEVIVKRSGVDDRASAGILAAELGHLPLALNQAGAYVDASGISLEEYLVLFRDYRNDLLRRNLGSGSEILDVASTFEIALHKVRTLSAEAADLVSLCSFLDSDGISIQFLLDGAPYLPEPLAAALSSPLHFNDLLIALGQYSIVEVRADGLAFHPLLHEIAREEMDQDRKAVWAEAAVTMVVAALPDDCSDPSVWSRCEPILVHAEKAAQHAEAAGLALDEVGFLWNAVGHYHTSRANYSLALPMYQKAKATFEALHGPTNVEAIAQTNNIANVLYHTEGSAQAMKQAETVASAITQSFVDEYPVEAAKFASNYATYLRDAGRYREARPYSEWAVEVHRQVLGDRHPTVATDLNNLGLLLEDLSEYAEAKAKIEEAREIYIEALGKDHHQVGIASNNLAGALRRLGESVSAKRLVREAIKIHETSVGKDHPQYTQDIIQYGQILMAEGRLPTAYTYLAEAREILQRAFGANSPEVGTVVGEIGVLLHKAGDLREARNHLEEALHIHESSLGEDHPQVAKDLSNLGLVLHATQDYQAALRLYKRALQINQRVFRQESFEVAVVLNNMGGALHNQGDTKGAKRRFRVALAIAEKILGPAHPFTVDVRSNLKAVL